MWIADIPPTKLARSGLSTIELNKKRPHVRNVELANELYRAFRVVAVRYQKNMLKSSRFFDQNTPLSDLTNKEQMYWK